MRAAALLALRAALFGTSRRGLKRLRKRVQIERYLSNRGVPPTICEKAPKTFILQGRLSAF